MSENQLTRRQFIKGAAATAGVAFASHTSTFPIEAKKTATDQVTLGNTGIKLSRLGI
jgi:phosphodiesterase/alkaline phosphatase D-like protein